MASFTQNNSIPESNLLRERYGISQEQANRLRDNLHSQGYTPRQVRNFEFPTEAVPAEYRYNEPTKDFGSLTEAQGTSTVEISKPYYSDEVTSVNKLEQSTYSNINEIKSDVPVQQVINPLQGGTAEQINESIPLNAGELFKASDEGRLELSFNSDNKVDNIAVSSPIIIKPSPTNDQPVKEAVAETAPLPKEFLLVPSQSSYQETQAVPEPYVFGTTPFITENFTQDKSTIPPVVSSPVEPVNMWDSIKTNLADSASSNPTLLNVAGNILYQVPYSVEKNFIRPFATELIAEPIIAVVESGKPLDYFTTGAEGVVKSGVMLGEGFVSVAVNPYPVLESASGLPVINALSTGDVAEAAYQAPLTYLNAQMVKAPIELLGSLTPKAGVETVSGDRGIVNVAKSSEGTASVSFDVSGVFKSGEQLFEVRSIGKETGVLTGDVGLKSGEPIISTSGVKITTVDMIEPKIGELFGLTDKPRVVDSFDVTTKTTGGEVGGFGNRIVESKITDVKTGGIIESSKGVEFFKGDKTGETIYGGSVGGDSQGVYVGKKILESDVTKKNL